MIADDDLFRHAVENLVQADALLFGRVTYEMMEAAFRSPAGAGVEPQPQFCIDKVLVGPAATHLRYVRQ